MGIRRNSKVILLLGVATAFLYTVLTKRGVFPGAEAIKCHECTPDYIKRDWCVAPPMGTNECEACARAQFSIRGGSVFAQACIKSADFETECEGANTKFEDCGKEMHWTEKTDKGSTLCKICKVEGCNKVDKSEIHPVPGGVGRIGVPTFTLAIATMATLILAVA